MRNRLLFSLKRFISLDAEFRFNTPGSGKIGTLANKNARFLHRQQKESTLLPSADLIASSVTKSLPARRRSSALSKWLAFGMLATGTTLCAYNLFMPDFRTFRDSMHYYENWKVRLFISLPWNAVSRLTGYISVLPIPLALREPILGCYVRLYGCRMDESLEPSLRAYPTFNSFFNRNIKSSLRPISRSLLISPADGTVLHFGKIVNGKLEYVKGNDYGIEEFLGPVKFNTRLDNSLYQVVIYLAPGDYHGFHSPTIWQMIEKTHVPGRLLSVRPSVFRWIPNLFCLNERIVLTGTWRHGFFSMSAVAATNVGDIAILNKTVVERDAMIAENMGTKNHPFNPGEKVGEFRLGSTVVLAFEAPSDLKFCIKAGDRLRYGQSLVLQHI